MNAHVKTPVASVSERIARAAAVAARYADDVDQKGRFPAEAMQALKDERLMGVQIPVELGGEDTRLPKSPNSARSSVRPAVPRR